MVSKSRLGLFVLILFVFIASLSMLAGGAAAQDAPAPGCPAGQGYWKNTAVWPVTQLTLGSQNYSQAELLILFNTAVEGDASVNLAHQLAAAKLNGLNGVNMTVISGVIAQADALLAGYTDKLPYNVDPASSEGQTMVNLAGVLDSFNNGQLALSCLPETTPEATLEATPESTPEATHEPDEDLPITIVIEGPVQAININIITIYNINIQLNPDDPALKVIQIGDIVHVEGDTEQSGDTIIIIAITVVVVNVDINPSTGDTYHDTGECANPPPPWAPAYGWHRKCDPQNNQGNDNGKHGHKGDDD